MIQNSLLKYASRAAVVSLLACTMVVQGCSTAWVTTVGDIISVAAPALINVLNIISIAKNQTVQHHARRADHDRRRHNQDPHCGICCGFSGSGSWRLFTTSGGYCDLLSRSKPSAVSCNESSKCGRYTGFIHFTVDCGNCNIDPFTFARVLANRGCCARFSVSIGPALAAPNIHQDI